MDDKNNDLKSALIKIDALTNLGGVILKLSPYLVSLKNTINWYDNSKGIFNNDKFLEPIIPAVNLVNNWDFNNFSLNEGTSSFAYAISATAATTDYIKSAPVETHFLVKQLKDLNPTEKLMDLISLTLKKINNKIYDESIALKTSYAAWSTNLRDNSDLGKDLRNFQEHFQGELHKYRVPKSLWSNPKNFPADTSWNKLYDKIGLKGSQNKKEFLKQRTISEQTHSRLSEILKNNTTVSKAEADSLFKRYIESVLTLLNLIDQTIF